MCDASSDTPIVVGRTTQQWRSDGIFVLSEKTNFEFMIAFLL
jgi:hypothetical protein